MPSKLVTFEKHSQKYVKKLFQHIHILPSSDRVIHAVVCRSDVGAVVCWKCDFWKQGGVQSIRVP